MIKNVILSVGLFCVLLVKGQEQFVIDENGLTPKYIVSQVEDLTRAELYSNTLKWIEANNEFHNIAIASFVESERILLTSIKSNAVNLDKQYYNVKYDITLEFDDNSFTFMPSKIQLKLNSKYDMGWKNFSLTSGAQYFKKGKIIRKYKRYLRDLAAKLNELNMQLNTDLKTE
jgi:hypothetical protein